MEHTVEAGFRAFLRRLTPTESETEAAKRHRKSIRECLEANFGLEGFFRTGSFGNGTSVTGYSDVDYFAVIPEVRLWSNSTTSLSQIRDALAGRFPNTGVRVDCPAIRVPFGTGGSETTEIVPADWVSYHSDVPGFRTGYDVYDIPDCSGNWMRSSPEAHNWYVREVDRLRGGKVKPLIRFMKAWKYFRKVPVSSFYLELRIARYAQEEEIIIYDLDILGVLTLLARTDLASMQDPMGVSGYIRPCSTQSKLEESFSKLSNAFARAQKAVEARKRGAVHEAFGWWDLFFDGQFPDYGP